MTAPTVPAATRPVDDPDGAPDADSAGPDFSTGIMVALMVPPVAADQLAIPDGLAPDELHVTLAYLGSTEDLDDPANFLQDLLSTVVGIADEHDPIEGVAGGVGRFCGGDDTQADPFYASVDAPHLDELRGDLTKTEGQGHRPSGCVALPLGRGQDLACLIGE